MLHARPRRCRCNPSPTVFPDTHFESAPDDELAALDEALFEFAHLLADLAAVDGAVGLE